MKKSIREITRHIAIKIFVALIRLTSRPDVLEILQFAHTIYDLAALHLKWLPELPPLP